MKIAELLQRLAASLCKRRARALDKSLIQLLAKNPRLDGVQGVKCSNHFTPPKINYLAECGRGVANRSPVRGPLPPGIVDSPSGETGELHGRGHDGLPPIRCVLEISRRHDAA